MQNKIECLENLTLAKIAITLWKSFQFLFEKSRWNYNDWFINQAAVQQNAKNLLLTQNLSKKLDIFIEITGREIFLFIDYLNLIPCENLYSVPSTIFSKFLLPKLCWTAYGVINRRETLQLIVNDENINPLCRFEWSCSFCFKENIFKLWDKFSDNEKNYFLQSPIAKECRDDIDIVSFWALYIGNQQHRIQKMVTYVGFECLDEYAFYQAIYDYNLEAADYFFSKLSNENQNANLEIVTTLIVEKYQEIAALDYSYQLYNHTYGHINAIVLFLTKRISEEFNPSVIFGSIKVYIVLVCFLDWPYQDQFLDTVKSLQPYMDAEDYYAVILHIIKKIVFPFHDYDYFMLLKEIWIICFQSGVKFNESALIESAGLLMFHRGISSVPFIFKYLSPPMQKQLVFSEYFCELCQILAFVEKWDILSSLIEIFIPTNHLEDFQSQFALCNIDLENDDDVFIIGASMLFSFLNEVIVKRKKVDKELS